MRQIYGVIIYFFSLTFKLGLAIHRIFFGRNRILTKFCQKKRIKDSMIFWHIADFWIVDSSNIYQVFDEQKRFRKKNNIILLCLCLLFLTLNKFCLKIYVPTAVIQINYKIAGQMKTNKYKINYPIPQFKLQIRIQVQKFSGIIWFRNWIVIPTSN